MDLGIAKLEQKRLLTAARFAAFFCFLLSGVLLLLALQAPQSTRTSGSPKSVALNFALPVQGT